MPPPTEPEQGNLKPTKPKKNKEHILKFRLSDEELEMLKAHAEGHKSLSDFIRYCCLKQVNKNANISKKVEDRVEALTKEVNAVGKNINQIARYVNFLEDNDIVYAPSIERFNHEITRYTANQIKIETLLKQILKD